MKRRNLILPVLVTVAVVGFAGLRLTTHRAPAGQAPLAYLDATSLGALKADFNRAVDETRMIVLLSPT